MSEESQRGTGEARREPVRDKGRAGLLLRPAMSPCGHTQMKLMPMSQEQLRPAGLGMDLDGGGQALPTVGGSPQFLDYEPMKVICHLSLAQSCPVPWAGAGL